MYILKMKFKASIQYLIHLLQKIINSFGELL